MGEQTASGVPSPGSLTSGSARTAEKRKLYTGQEIVLTAKHDGKIVEPD